MRIGLLAALVALPLWGPPALAQAERVSFAELTLEGPLGGVEIEIPGEGVTRLEGALSAGERRTLVVPLPLRAPLWRETLPALSLPEARVRGGGAGARARLTGFASPQPLARLESLPPGLRVRPDPPAPAAPSPRPGAGLLALAAGLALSIVLRRRPLPLVLAALVCACLVWVLLASTGGGGGARTVLEGDLGAGLWLERRAARDELELGFDALRVRPEGARLELIQDLEGRGRARAQGAVLVARRRVAGPGTLEPGANDAFDLEQVWTRDRVGTWRFHGAWARGTALGSPRPGPGVPGWLAVGLSPGTRMLVGRLGGRAGEVWVRASGFSAG